MSSRCQYDGICLQVPVGIFLIPWNEVPVRRLCKGHLGVVESLCTKEEIIRELTEDEKIVLEVMQR